MLGVAPGQAAGRRDRSPLRPRFDLGQWALQLRRRLCARRADQQPPRRPQEAVRQEDGHGLLADVVEEGGHGR